MNELQQFPHITDCAVSVVPAAPSVHAVHMHQLYVHHSGFQRAHLREIGKKAEKRKREKSQEKCQEKCREKSSKISGRYGMILEMEHSAKTQERRLYQMLMLFLFACVAAALLHDNPGEAVSGFLQIQKQPARLIQDFTVAGGVGGALLNASAVAAISLFLTRAVGGVRLSGPTIAAFFTLFGFGLFGKTPINILPIIFGVFIASRIAGKTFQEYILIALFGTALGPLSSYVVVEMGLFSTGIAPGIVQAGAGTGSAAVYIALRLLAGAAAGTAAGILLPPAAMAMLHLHQGYNLYNMGLTCGFIGLFAASVLHAAGGSLAIEVVWLSDPMPLLIWLIPLASFYLILCGFLLDKKTVLKDVLSIQKMSGRLPSDFMDRVSNGSALFNTGLLGLLSWLYVYAVGGDFNGPVLGGIFTVLGFGVFGKHLRNCIPVMAGVVISCLVFGKPLSDPGPLLAVLFATTLAPLAGEFGPLTGIIAGFLHLVMVERTGAWHGGIDLYNNGFAGGLTAALIFSVIEWFRNTRPDPYEKMVHQERSRTKT